MWAEPAGGDAAAAGLQQPEGRLVGSAAQRRTDCLAASWTTCFDGLALAACSRSQSPAGPHCRAAGEALDGANKYKCPKQQKAVRAVKRMTVDAAPNVLMIQLKRFEFSFSGHKISKKVGVIASGPGEACRGGAVWAWHGLPWQLAGGSLHSTSPKAGCLAAHPSLPAFDPQ